MGRSIYADEVGSNADDTWVHKFWVAVQPSDVDDYLNSYEPGYLLAMLSTEDEANIKAKMDELKDEFATQYSIGYDEFLRSNELNEFADPLTDEDKLLHGKQLLASRINLGEHLLATIENMKKRGIDRQELTIEC